MKISIIALIAAAGALTAATAYANHHEGKGQMKMAADKWESMVEEHFTAFDADADGSVTEAEFLEAKMAKAKAQFAMMAGEDSILSLDEAKTHHQAKMAEHKAKMKAYEAEAADADEAADNDE